MPPLPLNLNTFKLKKVFTNDVNDGYASASSGNEQSAIASASSGPSSGRQTVTSPTLERPLRPRRRIKKVLSAEPTNEELESESSQPNQSPQLEPEYRSLSQKPSVMNFDGSVRLPHRKPALIIRSRSKKVLPHDFTKDTVDSESSNPSQSPCMESEFIDETLPTSKRRLKHRGFALARGENLEEAVKNWSAVEVNPDITTEEVEGYDSESVYSQESESPNYRESLVDPWLNSKSQ
ncbi:hypothetical protein DFH28DRAFT_1184095 [Melampsora americana]|nr:hypothetical protein DFH28DRAFT_1184095 [Melampsora americana]